MSLADELADAAQAKAQEKKTVCKLGGIINELDPEDAATLNDWLDRPSVQTTMIGTVLRNRGLQVSDSVVGRHRRRGCPCVSS